MDSWATTYLQIAFGLFFFGLGVPAYVFQTLVPDEVKRAVRRNRILESEMIGLALIYLSAVFILIWMVPGRNGLSDEAYRALARVLLSVVVLLTAFFWALLAVRPMFDTLIKELLSGIISQIGWSPVIPSANLAELVSVGRLTSEAEERRTVLNSLSEIATVVQARSGYRGNALGPLIEGVEEIAVRDARVADEGTALCGFKILFSIIRTSEKLGFAESPDIHNALLVMRRIAIAALRDGAMTSGFVFLNILSEVRSDEAINGIFEIGRMALVERQFLVSMQAINLLEGRIVSVHQKSVALAGYLGLVAHWWSREGQCQVEAADRVRRVWKSEVAVLFAQVTYASDFFRDLLDFDTTDNLDRFLGGRDKTI